MPSTTDAGATPAATGATPVQTPPTTGRDGTGTQPATGAPDTDQPLGEAGRKALQAERDAAKDWKTKAETAQRELQALQEKDLTESEKRDKRLAELERAAADHDRERQDWQTRESVTTSALRLGYADPLDAFSLIDRAAIEFDDAGKPKNVDKLLQDLLTAKPYLAGASRPGGSFDGGPRGASAHGADMNDMLRRAAGRA